MLMENKTLRIVHFGQKRMPSREGGVEIVAEQLAVRMAALGHEVTCINRRGHHVSGAEFDSETLKEYNGVRILSVPTIEKKGLAAASASFFATVKAAFGRYDVVHIHAEGPAVFCWLPKLFGKRVIVQIHGKDWARERWVGTWGSKYIKYGEKMAARHADEIIVLSRDMQQYFKETYDRNTVYIPNGVNRPVRKPAKLITRQWGLTESDYFLSLARLTAEKRIHLLIEAFKETNTDMKLVIAGGSSDSGDYVEKLHEMAKDDPRIIFTGFVQGQLLEELYSNAYCYVLPSELEGMPLSLLEAMSYGNCCLTSDIPECADVVGDKGLSFRTNDKKDLIRALQELADAPELVDNYKAEAADYICEKYHWDEIVEEILNLYRGK